MPPPMLVQEILMFCVITHSSKACLLWCKLTLQFYRYVLAVLPFLFSKQGVPFKPLSDLFVYVQPLLQELGKQNPQIMQLIQDNQEEFLRLINEPVDGDEENEMFVLFPCVLPHAFTCDLRLFDMCVLPEPGIC